MQFDDSLIALLAYKATQLSKKLTSGIGLPGYLCLYNAEGVLLLHLCLGGRDIEHIERNYNYSRNVGLELHGMRRFHKIYRTGAQPGAALLLPNGCVVSVAAFQHEYDAAFASVCAYLVGQFSKEECQRVLRSGGNVALFDDMISRLEDELLGIEAGT